MKTAQLVLATILPGYTYIHIHDIHETVTGQFRPLDKSDHSTQTLPTQTPPD